MTIELTQDEVRDLIVVLLDMEHWMTNPSSSKNPQEVYSASYDARLNLMRKLLRERRYSEKEIEEMVM